MADFREHYLKHRSTKAAALFSGLSETGGRVYELAAQIEAEIEAARIEQERIWGGSADLAPVIDEMRRLAEFAYGQNSAAAVKEARELLVEIARLKALLPKTSLAFAKAPGLPDDVWLAKYGPRA